jgi:hypothetical protein
VSEPDFYYQLFDGRWAIFGPLGFYKYAKDLGEAIEFTQRMRQGQLALENDHQFDGLLK